MTTDKYWTEWKWTPEKPYPETLETIPAMVKLRTGEELENFMRVKEWYSYDKGNFNHKYNHPLDIVAYKLASEEN